ncbi:MAG: RNA methyltransferase [Bacteroidaceae bacterium]|nr:RNA methyltransferase [Bacteroidaceae bacterium]
MEQTFELIAKTFQGLEEVLAQELIELGADEVQIGRRMVAFRGDQEMMYRANFCLRTAVRILKPIKHFRAKDPDDVYRAVKSIDWAEILDVDTTFAVDTTVYSTEFRNSKFVAYKVKDAIVDFFMETQQKRPNISVANPDLRLNMHIAEEECTLSLDSSGESLHLRGYREASVEAPINEVLAAALIRMSGWKFDTDFVDPFCGSGTLLVEAALMARNIYPGVFRKKFAFENWKDFNAELFNSIFEDDSQEREFTHHIYGFDLEHAAVAAAIANAKSAGVADLVTVEQRDILDFVKPAQPAVMITNPPYGERLRPEEIGLLYRTLGEKLKKEFQGNDAWVITSREELFDAMRLRPSYKVPLQNGALDCELRKYVTFDGRLENFRDEGGIVKTDEEKQRMGEKGRFRDGRKREFSRKRGEFGDDDRDFDRDDRGFGRGSRDDREGRFDRRRDDRPRRFDDDRSRRFEGDRREHRSDRDFDRRDGYRDRNDFDRDYAPAQPDFADDPEMAAAYRNLRARHKTFERVRDAKERKERGDFAPRGERKPFDRERKPFDRDRKPFDRDRKSFDRDRKSFDRRDSRPRGRDNDRDGQRRWRGRDDR